MLFSTWPLADFLKTFRCCSNRGFAAVALRKLASPLATEALLSNLETSRWCPIASSANPY